MIQQMAPSIDNAMVTNNNTKLVSQGTKNDAVRLRIFFNPIRATVRYPMATGAKTTMEMLMTSVMLL